MSDIKERIRRLLNLANDNDAQGEIENALRFARRLMLRAGLTEDDFKERSVHEIAADLEYGDRQTTTTGAKMSQWESWLSTAIAQLVGSVGVYCKGKGVIRDENGLVKLDAKGRPKKGVQVIFYGPVVDAAEAVELFNEWALVIAAMGRARFGGVFRGEGRSYCEGFASALHEKLRKILKIEQTTAQLGESDSTALSVIRGNALMIAKKTQGKRWLQTQGVQLRSRGGGGGEHHSGAFDSGRADGSRADFSRSKVKRITG